MRLKWCFGKWILTSSMIFTFVFSQNAVCPNVFAATRSTHSKVIYLTFDDGPSLLYTPRILSILQKNHVQATFFVLGQRVQRFPKITKSIIQNGNEIGNHGYSHDYLSKKDSAWVVLDVLRTDKLIRTATGHKARYYRPPGGIITTPEAKSVRRIGHPIALWTVDSRDWCATNSADIVHHVLTQVRPGCIVLMHDGVSSSRYTALALPTIIRDLKARGYQFRYLPQN